MFLPYRTSGSSWPDSPEGNVLSQFIRLVFIVVSILAVIALFTAALCLGGLGIGSLLNALVPSIDFGTAVLIAVVGLGFSGAMVLAVLIIFPPESAAGSGRAGGAGDRRRRGGIPGR